MAGIIGIYGLVVSVLISNSLEQQLPLFAGFIQLGAGLSVGLSGLAAGFAIGIVGDAGVRGTAQQPRLFVGMILILIFAEVLGKLASTMVPGGSMSLELTRFVRSIRSHCCTTDELVRWQGYLRPFAAQVPYVSHLGCSGSRHDKPTSSISTNFGSKSRHTQTTETEATTMSIALGAMLYIARHRV